jgi:hypothetical protein
LGQQLRIRFPPAPSQNMSENMTENRQDLVLFFSSAVRLSCVAFFCVTQYPSKTAVCKNQSHLSNTRLKNEQKRHVSEEPAKTHLTTWKLCGRDLFKHELKDRGLDLVSHQRCQHAVITPGLCVCVCLCVRQGISDSLQPRFSALKEKRTLNN